MKQKYVSFVAKETQRKAEDERKGIDQTRGAFVSPEEHAPGSRGRIPSGKFSRDRVANKRRNNRLPVYFSVDGSSCFSFTVTAPADHGDDDDAYEERGGAKLPAARKEREEKRRSCRQLSPNGEGSFTRFFLPPRRFILRLVAFFLPREFDSTRTAYTRRPDANHSQFSVPASFISFLPSPRAIITDSRQHRRIIARLYSSGRFLLFFLRSSSRWGSSVAVIRGLMLSKRRLRLDRGFRRIMFLQRKEEGIQIAFSLRVLLRVRLKMSMI